MYAIYFAPISEGYILNEISIIIKMWNWKMDSINVRQKFNELYTSPLNNEKQENKCVPNIDYEMFFTTSKII